MDNQSSEYQDRNITPHKRGREPESNADYSSPRNQQNRRYNDRNPREQQRRKTGGYLETPIQRPISVAQQITDNFMKAIWSLGDSDRFDFRYEIPELIKRIDSHYSQLSLIDDILKAFRIAAAELPHKLPHLALLISILSIPGPPSNDANKPDESISTTPSIGLQIIRDLARTFQLHIDNRRWRSTRLYLHLFGHLHSLSRPLVSSQSLLALLRAIFSATTDELTCTGARADECLRIVCEGLLRSNLLKIPDEDVKKDVNELVESIRVHMVVNRRLDRSLFNEPDCLSQYIDPIEELVAALEGADRVDILPVLDEAFGPLLEQRISASGLDSSYPKPFDLPIVLLPPDVDEPDLGAHPPAHKPENLGNHPGPIPLDSKDRTNYLGVKLYYKLFSDNTVPTRAKANGVILRTLVNDVIDIFEVNRKECAKILLELPRWVGKGTFKTKSSIPKPKHDDEESTIESSDLILEHLLLESILTSVFAIPTPPIRPAVYYHSLIVELCRLSPSTVAPALGKSVRRLYAGLGEIGNQDTFSIRLEPEGIRRFSDWFGIHLSNFGFLWAWKDWTEVCELPVSHPKRVFVARVIELEIRLSYYDRIKETVPSKFLEVGIMSNDPPGPTFEYEDPAHRDHLAALDVVQLLKHKEPVSRLLDYLTKMQERLTNEGVQESVQDVTREVAIQSLLNVGSRSFSHFLNVLERYLELLKTLTNSASSRAILLKTVTKFWKKNGQFELIIIDKLLEYRVIDPIDSLHHSFESYMSSEDWSELQFWDGLKLTIEKVNRRVKNSKSKLVKLNKDHEDLIDRERAAVGEILETGNGPTHMEDINMKEANETEEEKKKDSAEEEGPSKEVAEEEKKEKVEGEGEREGEGAERNRQLKEELEAVRREEIVATEKELESNLAEQVVVLAEAIRRFSSARSEAEEKLSKEQEIVTTTTAADVGEGEEKEKEASKGEGDKVDPIKTGSKTITFWKAWWLRGWCREFYRSFGTEISTQFDQIMEKLDHPHQQQLGVGGDLVSAETGSTIVSDHIKEELKLTKDWFETVGFHS
ncbi:hypothetical protein MJO29_014868 [Puccinia striiformis f. sp. tritici]|nr:hypothetical protein MJO29_014868 [Puccinia striiformis f. sp. tritici]